MVQKFYFVISVLLVSACLQVNNSSTANQPAAITLTPEGTTSPALVSLLPTPTLTVAPTTTLVVETTRQPSQGQWTGLPSYVPVAERQTYPHSWQLEFDPALWQLETADADVAALVYRDLPSCRIASSVGRGLPPNQTHEDFSLEFADRFFAVVLVSSNGVPDFANYCSEVADSYTCFSVGLQESPDLCREQAEKVLMTLTTVPAIIPTAAPTTTEASASRPGWSTYTVPNVIAFDYPNDWEVLIDVPMSLTDFTGFTLNPSATTGLDPYIARIMAGASVVPKAQESTLYLRTGQSFTGQGNGAPTRIVTWDKTVTLNGRQWHLYILGQTGTRTWDGLDYLAEKGAMTEGALSAVHYITTKELALMVSQELDREMLIALHEQGGDALFPTHLPVLAALLESISIAE